MNNENSHPISHQGSFLVCLKGSLADQLLLLVLLLGIGALWLNIHQHLGRGLPTAYVYHQQQLLATYPLPMGEQVIHVAAIGEIGESQIEISKHGIRFISSPCTTQYCTLSGHKEHVGSVIACVPNHIMAVLRGARSENEHIPKFDAISE